MIILDFKKSINQLLNKLLVVCEKKYNRKESFAFCPNGKRYWGRRSQHSIKHLTGPLLLKKETSSLESFNYHELYMGEGW